MMEMGLCPTKNLLQNLGGKYLQFWGGDFVPIHWGNANG
jgi:hypothetical protein